MNSNFYNELSYYCTPYIYEKLEYILNNKQNYLNNIVNSTYKYKLITHLSLVDFIYVFNLLEEIDIMIIFRYLCINGYEDKIKYVCYNIEFVNDFGFSEEIIKYVIPHRNKNLVYFLIEYFQCDFNNFSKIFDKILLYNNLCLDVFIQQLKYNIEVYIIQAIYANRYKIFAYLIDLFKLNYKINNKKFIEKIIYLCIEKNKIQYIEYIHKNNLNKYIDIISIYKIKSFKMYKYLRNKVYKKEVFDQYFFYLMIKNKNKYFIHKCIEINKSMICNSNHSAIHISSGSIKKYLTDIHPCGNTIISPI